MLSSNFPNTVRIIFIFPHHHRHHHCTILQSPKAELSQNSNTELFFATAMCRVTSHDKTAFACVTRMTSECESDILACQAAAHESSHRHSDVRSTLLTDASPSAEQHHHEPGVSRCDLRPRPDPYQRLNSPRNDLNSVSKPSRLASSRSSSFVGDAPFKKKRYCVFLFALPSRIFPLSRYKDFYLRLFALRALDIVINAQRQPAFISRATKPTSQ